MLNKITVFSIIILLGFAFVLYWLGSMRFNEFYQSQKTVALETTDIVHLEIEKQLAQKKLLVGIFLEDHYELVSELANHPADEQLYHDLNAQLKRFFPDFFSVNIATGQGKPVIDDFEGNLGQLCIEDMQFFSKDKKQLIRIHPNQNLYHYDILMPFRVQNEDMILFVSFEPSNIASLLHTSQSYKHKLILVQEKREHLIEIIDKGARNKLEGRLDYRLDQNEKDRVLSSNHVDGTYWEVIDMHAPDLFVSFKRSLIKESTTIYLFFFVIIVVMLIILYRGDKKRVSAERQLEKNTQDVIELNIQLSLANEELEKLSITDGLTGIYNRRHLDEKLSEEWERAKRLGIPLAFALIDIDYFKQYNDLYGHQAGDECLINIARVLAETFRRAGDLVARYGGEELAVVTLVDSQATIISQIEKFRTALKELQFKHKGSKVSEYVTVSTGVTFRTPDASLSAKQFVKEADEALYKAKANGRNQIVTIGE